MPRLIIDDQEIEVPDGTKVIEAAERLGIVIPRFCYHEALGSVGACRMCAVKFLQGPFKGVQMSCMIDAQDGMVVSTTDPEAVAFRKWVIECLMLNHPLDCPVCDEGGQCLLQDETVSSGHAIRRFLGKKRTYRDQYLGPYIHHEMNRCIHCYRCSRFYQEFAGYRDLGPQQIGDRVYFGRFRDGTLESPFSGNLVDICPTGVYTDKPARFKVRRWDLERAPSLCIHCSLGCNTVGNAHYRAVMRIEARLNRAVNGYFICDECRFGFSYSNGGAGHDMRPWSPRAGGLEVTARKAFETAAERLAEVAGKPAPGEASPIAAIGSDRNSLETQCMLKRVCRTNKWRDPVFFMDGAISRKVRSAVGKLDERIARSMCQIETSDFVIVVGADPLNEGASSALAIRQAFRRKAPVVVIDPRPVSMPLDFEHIAVGTDRLEICLGMLVRGVLGKDAPQKVAESARKLFKPLPAKYADQAIHARLMELSERLKAAREPVIVCGTDIVRETTPAFAADCALLMNDLGGRAGIFYLLPGADSFSSALLSGGSLPDILDEIEKGSIRALVAVESDPFSHFHDRERLEQALSKLELLVAIDYLPTPMVERASVFCPSSTIFETGSTFINQEGRVQYAKPVHHGGKPIWGEQPPHIVRDYVPGGDHRPAWEVLWAIAGEPIPAETQYVPMTPGEWIAAEHPALEGVNAAAYPVDGLKIIPGPLGSDSAAAPGKKAGKAPDLELLLVRRLFATGELAAYADTLDDSVPEPDVFMHVKDAEAAGLADGDTVRIELGGGPVEARLSVSDRMARGVLVLPRHNRLHWQKIKDPSAGVALKQISKV